MNIKGEYGFFLEGKWYPNTWRGHEGNAFFLINEKGWLEDWRKKNMSAQDYLVSEKNAIQLGSQGNTRIIVVKKEMSEIALREFVYKYGLDECEIQAI